jgi:hypothetical protein
MVTKEPAKFRELPGASLIIGPSLPNPPAEFVPTGANSRSVTGSLSFAEVLKRVPKIRELRRPTLVRRLATVAERRHAEFLSRIASATDTESPLVSPATAELAQRLWDIVRHQTGKRVPAASVGEDRSILYTWDAGDHHLEAEICEGQPVEWMYANRQTRETWFASLETTSELTPDLLARFRLID